MEAELKTFIITENGFTINSNKVSVPACKIKATSYEEANDILTSFLDTRVKPDSIELITPIERIEFN